MTSCGLTFTIRRRCPRATSSYAPHVDPAIDTLVMQMLAKEPASRPKDGMAVARWIQRLIDAGAGRAPPSLQAYRDAFETPLEVSMVSVSGRR